MNILEGLQGASKTSATTRLTFARNHAGSRLASAGFKDRRVTAIALSGQLCHATRLHYGIRIAVHLRHSEKFRSAETQRSYSGEREYKSSRPRYRLPPRKLNF